MRRCLFVLVTLSSFTTIASAQSPAPVPPVPVQGGNGVFFISGATTIAGRTNPDDILARMLSFDTNHDGRIAPSELPERMQPLVTRGDANLDGVLETTEIRTLSLRPATFPPVRGFGEVQGGHPVQPVRQRRLAELTRSRPVRRLPACARASTARSSLMPSG